MTKTTLTGRTLHSFILVCGLGACVKQTLESGELGNADALADNPAALTCTQNGTVYSEGAAMPGAPLCDECQCLHGRMQCPERLCAAKEWRIFTAKLKPSKPVHQGDPELPAIHQFSVLIDREAKTVTTGSGGSDNQVSLVFTSNGEWATQGNLDLVMTFDAFWSANRSFAAQPVMRYQQIVFQGLADGWGAHATGTYMVANLDIVYNLPFEAELANTIDRSGPSFTIYPNDQTELHPLDLRGVAVNELLPVRASARLLTADGAAVPLSPIPVGSAVGVSGFVLDKRALAFATSYRLEITPSAVDLAGNLATQLPSLTTRTGPGFFAQDGFEGPVDALLGGQVKVIDATTLTVPTGNRALRFAPVDSSATSEWSCDDRFTARLAVPPGATSVKLSALALRSTGVFQGWLRLAVPNGAITEYRYWVPSTGELKQVELPLPAGVGREVIFDLYRPCSEPQLWGAGAILDDLRVE